MVRMMADLKVKTLFTPLRTFLDISHVLLLTDAKSEKPLWLTIQFRGNHGATNCGFLKILLEAPSKFP